MGKSLKKKTWSWSLVATVFCVWLLLVAIPYGIFLMEKWLEKLIVNCSLRQRCLLSLATTCNESHSGWSAINLPGMYALPITHAQLAARGSLSVLWCKHPFGSLRGSIRETLRGRVPQHLCPTPTGTLPHSTQVRPREPFRSCRSDVQPVLQRLDERHSLQENGCGPIATGSREMCHANTILFIVKF